ncbi:MAG TPA: hypothetical protein VKB34_13570 [Povalibacter sp.]|nr:hypothetical protein [Povalibacter sp.]
MPKAVRKGSGRISQLSIAVHPETSFEDLVKILRVRLTVPELPGIRGCNPCNSGIPKIVLEDIATIGR